jgi:DNA-binding GntR family transcriptional regulator
VRASAQPEARRRLSDKVNGSLVTDLPDTKRVVRSSLGGQVADIIREQILTGELHVGDRVVQAEWAARLQVSRMPVRDAIVSLCHEGLLHNTASGAAVVAPVDVDVMADIFEVNALVAGQAARRAATRVSEQEIGELDRLQEQLAQAVAGGDMHAASEINWSLHRVVNRAADSPRLSALLRTLSTGTPRTSFELIPGWGEQALEDHKQLIAALRDGDGERAYEVAREHVARGTGPLLEQLEARFAADKRAQGASPAPHAAVGG